MLKEITQEEKTIDTTEMVEKVAHEKIIKNAIKEAEKEIQLNKNKNKGIPRGFSEDLIIKYKDKNALSTSKVFIDNLIKKNIQHNKDVEEALKIFNIKKELENIYLKPEIEFQRSAITMIDGPWGSGKTYFIENLLLNFEIWNLEEENKIDWIKVMGDARKLLENKERNSKNIFKTREENESKKEVINNNLLKIDKIKNLIKEGDIKEIKNTYYKKSEKSYKKETKYKDYFNIIDLAKSISFDLETISIMGEEFGIDGYERWKIEKRNKKLIKLIKNRNIIGIKKIIESSKSDIYFYQKLIKFDVMEFAYSKNIIEELMSKVFSTIKKDIKDKDLKKHFKKSYKYILGNIIMSFINKKIGLNFNSLNKKENKYYKYEESMKIIGDKMPRTVIFFDNIERLEVNSWDIIRSIFKLAEFSNFCIVLSTNLEKLNELSFGVNDLTKEYPIEKYINTNFFKLRQDYKGYLKEVGLNERLCEDINTILKEAINGNTLSIREVDQRTKNNILNKRGADIEKDNFKIFKLFLMKIWNPTRKKEQIINKYIKEYLDTWEKIQYKVNKFYENLPVNHILYNKRFYIEFLHKTYYKKGLLLESIREEANYHLKLIKKEIDENQSNYIKDSENAYKEINNIYNLLFESEMYIHIEAAFNSKEYVNNKNNETNRNKFIEEVRIDILKKIGESVW